MPDHQNPCREFLGYTRDGHTFLFAFDPQKTTPLLQQFASFAGNPNIPFSWFDAAKLSRQVRERSNDASTSAAGH
ncbi:hypothetical protein [Roseiconus lacunae]|uniref:KTSC domain-containing protein n=1 Tax=Roseiconus lacunae TaxID=2605694 RepID=A0ABT7PH51_9BACT|nr:hypothetical protein [Roseiconus lacunae]MDM4015837.1 hypothetical protein [Roseiconus lacunae]